MAGKKEHADRSAGGPGSSHRDATDEAADRDPRREERPPGSPTNPDRSRVSGGGGERDRHHTHDPARKR